jgi:galactosylceramidase
MRWEGVGAISGGGATTKLLMDYPKDVVADILDFMFKPNFGLDLDILKVEMGGDTDSTEGAEPSHMHAGFTDANYNRGYEWWLMKEAKARKPSLKLYGLPWGWPGWLDPSATPSKQASNAFADPNITANYTLSFLLGAKNVHGLTIDYMGQWNERNAPAAYNDALRRVVSTNAELGGKTTVLNRLPHYPGTGTTADTRGCTQYQWNTTDGSRWVDEEGSIYDGRSARCLARCVNRGYVTGCHSAMFQWHLISSFYDYLPWSRCGVAVANEPWSGNYEITSPTWAIAHTTQFAKPGWRYTAHGSGVAMLGKGGSIVTRISPDKKDFSIVVEKMTTDNSKCARGSNPPVSIASEDVVMILKGDLLAIAKEKGLKLWISNFSSGNDEGVNPDDSVVFIESLAPAIATDGSITIHCDPEHMFTLTTITTGHKGAASKPSPPKASFPLPFTQPFDDETVSSPPAIWYDQMGAWEVQPKSGVANIKSGDNVMRQVSPVWPACWGYSCSGPLTYFGPSAFNASDSLTMTVDVMIEAMDAKFSLGLGQGSKGKMNAGIEIDSSAGAWSLPGTTAKGSTSAFTKGKFHTIILEINSTSVAATLDGNVLGSGACNSGVCADGLYIQMGLDKYVYAQVDNWSVSSSKSKYE